MKINPTVLKSLHYAAILGAIAALTALQSRTDAFGGYGPLVGGACALALAEVRRRHPEVTPGVAVPSSTDAGPALAAPVGVSPDQSSRRMETPKVPLSETIRSVLRLADQAEATAVELRRRGLTDEAIPFQRLAVKLRNLTELRSEAYE